MQTKRLEGRDETILEPDLEILDAHIHLFDLPGNRYMFEDYVADAQSGHNIVGSIYCETQSFLRQEGPELLRPLGEIEFANGVAAMSASGRYGKCKVAHGIIGHANLTFGSSVGELLDQARAIAPERFRGIRHVTIEYPDDRPFQYVMTYRPPAGLLEHPNFRLGLRELERRELVFDTAIFDPSLPRIAELADVLPNLVFVLNHMGTAVGVGMTAQERGDVFRRWRTALADVAQRPNVHCKVGGLGMPHWGFGFELRRDSIGSAELAQAWRPYVETAIETFGPQRCMMESNFPPDGRSCGMVPLWNAYKLITAGASSDEKAWLYKRSAEQVYNLEI